MNTTQELPGYLPEEIWSSIISRLSFRDMVSCSEVSRGFSRITVDAARIVAKRALNTFKDWFIDKMQESMSIYEKHIRQAEKKGLLISYLTSDQIVANYKEECLEIEKFINADCFDQEDVVYLKNVISNLKMKFFELKFYLNRSKVAFSVVRMFPEFVSEIDASERDFGNYFKIIYELSHEYFNLIEFFAKKSLLESNILEKQNSLKIYENSIALLDNDIINGLKDEEKHEAIEDLVNCFLATKTTEGISGQVLDLLINVAISIKDEELCVKTIQKLYRLNLPSKHAPMIIEMYKSFKEERALGLLPFFFREANSPVLIEIIKGLREENAVRVLLLFIWQGLPEKNLPHVMELIECFAEDNKAAVFAELCQGKFSKKCFPIIIESIKNFEERNAFGVLLALCQGELSHEYFPEIIARIKHFQEDNKVSLLVCFCNRNLPEEHRVTILEFIQSFQENNQAQVLSALCQWKISQEHFSTVITLFENFKDKSNRVEVLVQLCKFRLPKKYREMAMTMMKNFKKNTAAKFFAELSKVSVRREYFSVFFESLKQFKEKQAMQILMQFCFSSQLNKNEKTVESVFELIKNFVLEQNFVKVLKVLCKKKALSEKNVVSAMRHAVGFEAKNATAVFNALCEQGVSLDAIPTLFQCAQSLPASERKLAICVFQLLFTKLEGIQAVHEKLTILQDQKLAKMFDEAFNKVLIGGKYTPECLKFLHNQVSASASLDVILKNLKNVLSVVQNFEKERYVLRSLQTLIELGVPEEGMSLIIGVAKRLSPRCATRFFKELIADQLPLKYIREIVDCVEGYPLNLKLKFLKKLATTIPLEDRATVQLAVMQLIGDRPEHVEEILALHANREIALFGDNIIFEKEA